MYPVEAISVVPLAIYNWQNTNTNVVRKTQNLSQAGVPADFYLIYVMANIVRQD